MSGPVSRNLQYRAVYEVLRLSVSLVNACVLLPIIGNRSRSYTACDLLHQAKASAKLIVARSTHLFLDPQMRHSGNASLNRNALTEGH